MIQDKNSKDLTEAEEIKKRQQEYTDELYKKGLNDPDNHNNVVTILQPDMECEVKQALGSITTIKASGGAGIPAQLFKILNDDAIRLLYSVRQQIWKTQQWPQGWKRSMLILSLKKGSTKKCSNTRQLLSSPRLVSVCQLLSHVRLFETPWIVARQAPLSMEFSRQEYWSRCHALLQGIFLTQEQTWVSCIAGRLFTI